MTKNPRHPRKKLRPGAGSRSRQIAPRGKAIHDEPARKAATAAAASGVKLRYMQTRLSERGWKSLKLLSIELGKPLQGLVIEALNDMLRKHGRAPDVTGPEPDKE
jgi:hypothetical protein